MSTWTHVVGCIRLDGLPRLLPEFTVGQIEDAIGPECRFDKWNDASTLPRGSEGSLQYRVIEYDTGALCVAVPFWGDLRDYGDLRELEIWFRTTLKKFKLVRDAVMTAYVEGGKSIILTDKGADNGS